MTIANGLGIASYQHFQDTRIEGGLSRVRGLKRVTAAANPILAQIGTLTFGGTETDGNYDTNILNTVTGVTVQVRTVRATTPATNTDLATQHAADINDNQDLNGVVTATSNGAVVTITFDHPGVVYTITTAAPSPGTLVSAVTQVAGGSTRTLARFIRYSGFSGGNKTAADLETTSVATDVRGFTLRPQAGEIDRPSGGLAADEDEYRAGEMVNSLEEGYVTVLSVDAASQGGQVFVVRDVTGGDPLGAARASAAGVAHVVEAAPTAANSTQYSLAIALVDDSTGETVFSQSYGYLSDASATETEIVAGFIAVIDASDLVTAWGASTANVADDLEVTAPVGYHLELQDTGVGVLAVAEITAAALYTIALPLSRARFEEDIAAGGLGEIWTNL